MPDDPVELLKASDVDGALKALQDKVRADPSNAALRIFLFQLLCVMGDWKRAVTQLKLSAELDALAVPMAQTYREAIICEVFREKVFAGEKAPLIFGEPQQWVADLIEALKALAAGNPQAAAEMRAKAFDAAPATPGTADGQRFDWIADADMRLGPVLEIIVNGRYFWMPFNAIEVLKIDPPADLRDAVWTAATLKLANGGECVGLIPTRYPGSAADPDGAVRLSRATHWADAGADTFIGTGQRLLTTDAGDVALMDLRSVEMDPAPAVEATAGDG
ncbi:type VI secretion system accessory protein TagJ [Meridianimarinicoccus sp. RP-17]|uniref:type VI secretion system accessory protein TagJ n=1 Tax=Meridianimarinicoccus zhengii TaxID=2056810 RepID=UPI000DAE018B|nr:type VI secretion system accessory protein TagJ [Phycocomes zhengii]